MRTPLPMNLNVALASAGGMELNRALRVIGAAVRRFYNHWHAQRRAAAAVRALQYLDARILRDIGFDRSEITSVVAELTGDADPSRVRTLRTQDDWRCQSSPHTERKQS